MYIIVKMQTTHGGRAGTHIGMCVPARDRFSGLLFFFRLWLVLIYTAPQHTTRPLLGISSTTSIAYYTTTMDDIVAAVRHACACNWSGSVVTHALQREDLKTLDAAVRAHVPAAIRLCEELERETKDITGCRGQARFVVSHLVTSAVFRHELPRVWREWGEDVHCRAVDVCRAIWSAGRRTTATEAIGLVILLRDPCPGRLFPVGVESACRTPKAAAAYLKACDTLGQFTHMFTVVAARDAFDRPCWRLFMAFQHEYSLGDYLGMPRAGADSISHMRPVLQPVHRREAQDRIEASPYRGRLLEGGLAALTEDLKTLDRRPTMDAVWLAAYSRLFCVDRSQARDEPTCIDADTKAWSVHCVPIATRSVAAAEMACETLARDMETLKKK